MIFFLMMFEVSNGDRPLLKQTGQIKTVIFWPPLDRLDHSHNDQVISTSKIFILSTDPSKPKPPDPSKKPSWNTSTLSLICPSPTHPFCVYVCLRRGAEHALITSNYKKNINTLKLWHTGIQASHKWLLLCLDPDCTLSFVVNFAGRFSQSLIQKSFLKAIYPPLVREWMKHRSTPGQN